VEKIPLEVIYRAKAFGSFLARYKGKVEPMAQLDLNEKDLPPELHPNKGILDLRNLIWRLVNAKELSEREENEIRELIKILRTKEHQDEENAQRREIDLPTGQTSL
jgi:phosphoribosylaminoimidazole-succinocarboxamide synthase